MQYSEGNLTCESCSHASSRAGQHSGVGEPRRAKVDPNSVAKELHDAGSEPVLTVSVPQAAVSAIAPAVNTQVKCIR